MASSAQSTREEQLSLIAGCVPNAAQYTAYLTHGYCIVGPRSTWHQHSPSSLPAGCQAASQFPACSVPGAALCTCPR